MQPSKVSGRILKDVDVDVEIAERERRKNNLMIFGLPEQTNGTYQDSIDKDRRDVENILKVLLSVAPMSDIYPIRVGRFAPGRIRPLKVDLYDANLVADCIRNSQALKESNYEHVTISHDRSPNQVEEYHKLRRELDKLNRDGKNFYKIKYIDGTPKIVKRLR